jgi:hypothetical protein
MDIPKLEVLHRICALTGTDREKAVTTLADFTTDVATAGVDHNFQRILSADLRFAAVGWGLAKGLPVNEVVTLMSLVDHATLGEEGAAVFVLNQMEKHHDR